MVFSSVGCLSLCAVRSYARRPAALWLFGNSEVLFDMLQYSVPCSGSSGEAERSPVNRPLIQAEMSSTGPEVERDGHGFEGALFLG